MSTRQSSRLAESKYDEGYDAKEDSTSRYSTRSMKDDMKQQYHELRGTAKQKGQQLKEQVEQGWKRAKDVIDSAGKEDESEDDNEEEDENEDEELNTSSRSSRYPIRNRLKERGADILEQQVEPRLRQAERVVDRTAKNLRSSARQPAEEEEEEEEGDEGEGWQSNLKRRGGAILEQVEDTAVRGAKQLKRKVEAWSKDYLDLDDAPEEEDEDESLSEGSEEEEQEEEEEEEDDEEDEEGGRDIRASLRSRARQAGQTARDASDRVTEKARKLEPTVRRATDKLKGYANEALDSSKSFVNQARAKVNEARTRGQFDLHQGKAGEEKGESWKERGRHWLDELKDKAEMIMAPSSPEWSDSPSPSESDENEEDVSTVGSQPGEDFSVRLEPIRQRESRSERSSTLFTPARVIGLLFSLWLLGSLYERLGHPADDIAPSRNLYDTARNYGRDFAHKADINLDRLRDQAQRFTDTIVGRKVEPTWRERLNDQWISLKESVLGKTEPRPARDAKNSILEGIDRFEKGTYDMVDKFKDDVIPELKQRTQQMKDGINQVKDYTKEHLIPGARQGVDRAQEMVEDSKDSINYHLHSARSTADNVAHMAREKASNMGILYQPTIGQRFWSWLTGKETPVQQAQRMAGEGLQKAKDMAGDVRDRVSGINMQGMKDRMEDGIDRAKESMTPHTTLGDRIQHGIDSIRSHLPGHKPTLTELGQDALHRARTGVDQLRGSTDELLHRARDSGEQIKDNIPSMEHIQDRTQDMMGYARHGVEQGIDNLKDQMPHASIGDRLKGGLNSILHNNIGLKVQDRLHHVKDGVTDSLNGVANGLHNARDRVIDGIGHMRDGVRNSVESARHRADDLVHRRQHPINDLHDDLKHEIHHSTNIHSDNLRPSGMGHVDIDSLPRGDAVPLNEVLEEISHVGEGDHIHKESLGQRVRHAVQDGVEAIKARLPGRGSIHLSTADDLTHRTRLNPDLTHRTAADDKYPTESVNRPLEPGAVRGLHRAGETIRHEATHLGGRLQDGVHNVEQRVRDTVSDVGSKGEEMIDRLKHGGEDALRNVRRDAQYVGRRTVHNIEKASHRVEEKYDEVKDKARYRMAV